MHTRHFGSVVASGFHVDGAGFTEAPLGVLGGDGVREINAGVEIHGHVLATAFQRDVDAQIQVGAHRHGDVHVGAHKFVGIVQKFRVDDIHREDVLSRSNDVNVK